MRRLFSPIRITNALEAFELPSNGLEYLHTYNDNKPCVSCKNNMQSDISIYVEPGIEKLEQIIPNISQISSINVVTSLEPGGLTNDIINQVSLKPIKKNNHE